MSSLWLYVLDYLDSSREVREAVDKVVRGIASPSEHDATGHRRDTRRTTIIRVVHTRWSVLEK